MGVSQSYSFEEQMAEISRRDRERHKAMLAEHERVSEHFPWRNIDWFADDMPEELRKHGYLPQNKRMTLWDSILSKFKLRKDGEA